MRLQTTGSSQMTRCAGARQRACDLASLATCVAAGTAVAAGCAGSQSTLDPAGQSAQRIAVLFWQMTAGATFVWLFVVALAVYAVYAARQEGQRWSRRSNQALIVGGGVILPTVVLAGLLSYGLALLPPLLAAAPDGSLRVAVTGEQYWWRVRYHGANGREIALANELRLPVGQPVQFELDSADVIHSFWIPALGGKVDMFPGRKTQLTLLPTRTGRFRGVCAEYCGTAHALMGMAVVVLEKPEFVAWLEQQQNSARVAASEHAQHGAELFVQNGCGACHSVRGTTARGVIGPDLTHVGSRLTLAAGTLPNEPSQFERFITATEHTKPGANMPHFGMLPREAVSALAEYLEGLQ